MLYKLKFLYIVLMLNFFSKQTPIIEIVISRTLLGCHSGGWDTIYVWNFSLRMVYFPKQEHLYASIECMELKGCLHYKRSVFFYEKSWNFVSKKKILPSIIFLLLLWHQFEGGVREKIKMMFKSVLFCI